jgi:aspartate aminotransferase-like enzyme
MLKMLKEKMVMIPGPTPVVSSIRTQMSREMQAFGDPRFVADYKKLITELGVLLNCSGQAFPLAGTGTLAMEMAIANTTKRGDNVLIVSHGYFGDRFIEICERKGLNADVLKAEWGKTIPLAQIKEALDKKAYAAITVSHVDTSTGVCAPIEEIGALMKNYPDTIYIVDGVAATGAEFEDVDGMNIDLLFTGSQKGFGVCPGMFVVKAKKKALKRRHDLGTIPEYYVDFEKWMPTMDNPLKYFATPAVNLVWAMIEATSIIKQEGYPARAERHRINSRAMHAAFTALGFKILAEESCRCVTLSNLIYPDGLDDSAFRTAVFEGGMTIAGGLAQYAGKMCRIGHMGNIDINDEITAISILERALIRCGIQVNPGQGVSVYMSEMLKAAR